jgi:hypothetical protein
MTSMATPAPGKPKPLYLLVLGVLLFGGGGVMMLWLDAHHKATTWLSAFGVSAHGQSVYVRIVSWAGIVLGVGCLWLLVRELRAKGRG